MVAGEPSAYFNAAEKEEEWLMSNITLYSDYMVAIKDTI